MKTEIVTQDFPIIHLGLGEVEIGDAMWEGFHSLILMRGGRGLDAPEMVHDRPAAEGETLALFPVHDTRGLDALQAAIDRVRAAMLKGPVAA